MSRLWQAPKANRAEPLAVARTAVLAGPPSWQDGYDEGLDEGFRRAQAEFAEDRAALSDMMAGLQILQPPSRDHLTALIAGVVSRLVTQVAGTAAVDADLFRARARAAADALTNEPEAIAIHVHPDDAAVIEGMMPFAVVADASMARGSIRAEAGDSWAADGIQEALARVHAELGQ